MNDFVYKSYVSFLLFQKFKSQDIHFDLQKYSSLSLSFLTLNINLKMICTYVVQK